MPYQINVVPLHSKTTDNNNNLKEVGDLIKNRTAIMKNIVLPPANPRFNQTKYLYKLRKGTKRAKFSLKKSATIKMLIAKKYMKMFCYLREDANTPLNEIIKKVMTAPIMDDHTKIKLVFIEEYNKRLMQYKTVCRH